LSDGNSPINLHVADHGVNAVAFLRHEGINVKAPCPDLILLDLNLPRMDGREVLVRIKTDDNLKTIPTIILTPAELYDDVMTNSRLRANAFLKKPLGWHAFVRVASNLNNFSLAQSKSQLKIPNHNRSGTWDKETLH
jgi:two-component system, chemotaxis family, response regulator Rcp1